MVRGDISNEMATLVAVDLGSLVVAPEPCWWLTIFQWLGRHRRLRKPYLFFLPRVIRRHKLTRDAEVSGWWLVSKGFRIHIIVRLPYAPGIQAAVEKILGEYPCDMSEFHLVPQQDIPAQALDINMHCRGERCIRFFTRDKDLARFLPTSLVRFVDQWDENLLH